MRNITLLGFVAFAFFSCKKAETITTNTPLVAPPENYYYPPLTGIVWETKTASSIGWN